MVTNYLTKITYLARFEEFKTPEQMKRVVNLLHRQVVKVKAEGLLFKVCYVHDIYQK